MSRSSPDLVRTGFSTMDRSPPSRLWNLRSEVVPYPGRKARLDPVAAQQLVRGPSEDGARIAIDKRDPPFQVQLEQDDFGRVQISLRPIALVAQGQLRLLAFGDDAANGHVLSRRAVVIQERHNRGVEPVERPVLRLILDFSVPDIPSLDSGPEIAHELFGVVSGIDEAMVLPHEFVARIPRDVAELVVHEANRSARVRHGHDRVLIDRVPEVDERRLGTLACAPTVRLLNGPLHGWHQPVEACV